MVTLLIPTMVAALMATMVAALVATVVAALVATVVAALMATVVAAPIATVVAVLVATVVAAFTSTTVAALISSIISVMPSTVLASIFSVALTVEQSQGATRHSKSFLTQCRLLGRRRHNGTSRDGREGSRKAGINKFDHGGGGTGCFVGWVLACFCWLLESLCGAVLG
jgi:uncharacterized protein YacL